MSYAECMDMWLEEMKGALEVMSRNVGVFRKRIFTIVMVVAALIVPYLEANGFEIDLRTARIETMPSCVTNESQKRAVQELKKHIALFAQERSISVNSSSVVFVIGKVAPRCKEAAAHETRAQAVGGKVYFWGDDTRDNKIPAQRWGTLYAVYGFLEKVLGVKWVGPGDKGIVFSPRKTVEVQEGWSYRFYPPLEVSNIAEYTARPYSLLRPRLVEYTPTALRVSEKEAREFGHEWSQWMRRLRHQTRTYIKSGHAFTDWNMRFAEKRPELLALDEKGQRGYPGENEKDSSRARWIKLCVSNPAVTDQIIADWCAGGTNEYLNICPNDAYGFCRCQNCTAWDADLPNESFNAHKTDRYVRFWNRVSEKAVAIKPDVTIVTYLYSSYRYPPRRERLLRPENFLFSVVPTVNEDSEKLLGEWRKMGVKRYFVRPNYLCYCAAPMRGLERFFCDDFKRNLAGGMMGVSEDNRPRPQEQFEFYTIGRLIAEPNLPFEVIEAEYLSQYGSAAAEMKTYFARVRARGEAGRLKCIETERNRPDGKKEQMLDDSQHYETAYSAHNDMDYAGDLKIVDRALAHTDLSEIERWRVNRVRAMIENARLTRKFILARDSMKMPEFAKVGRELILKRIELKDAIDDKCWGTAFRGYPAEIRWWMWIKDKYLKEFWEPVVSSNQHINKKKGK